VASQFRGRDNAEQEDETNPRKRKDAEPCTHKGSDKAGKSRILSLVASPFQYSNESDEGG
jgi:hypothetical protein